MIIQCMVKHQAISLSGMQTKFDGMMTQLMLASLTPGIAPSPARACHPHSSTYELSSAALAIAITIVSGLVAGVVSGAHSNLATHCYLPDIISLADVISHSKCIQLQTNNAMIPRHGTAV